MERVIYVAPHGALIEQTADFFRSIFGENNVCVHHINMDTDKMSTESLMACDNWERQRQQYQNQRRYSKSTRRL